MSAAVDPYATLELRSSATTAEIRAAYRRLVARDHADRHAGDPAAIDRTRRLNLARDVLLDPVRRARYDASRRPATPTRDPLLDTVARFGAEPPPMPRAPQPAPVAPAAGWLAGVGLGLLAAVAALGVGVGVSAVVGTSSRDKRKRRA